MKLPLYHFHRLKKYSWLTLCLICYFVAIATTASAEYKKPKQTSSPDSRTTTSTATRGGCLNRTQANLTAIAPYSHVGQTTSTHPTFAWYIPQSEYFPLEFHLEEYTADAQLKTIYRQKIESQPGIMSLSLPQDLPGLKTGKKYRWKVVMRCTRYRAIVTMAEIKVASPTSEFKAAYAKTSGTSKLVDLYASTGLWYDALAITINAADFQQQELQNKLIQELAAVETESSSSSIQQQGEKLIQIGDRLRTSKLKSVDFNN